MGLSLTGAVMIDIDTVKRTLLGPRVTRGLEVDAMLSTGSTLLNLAISGQPDGGIPAGKYVFFVGDSSSGKTFLALTCLAEAQLHKTFRDYRIIFDNSEDGAMMDLERYFGRRVAEKLEPPAGTREEPEYSQTIEEFYFNLDDALAKAAKGRPFIYVLDSMDSLSSKYEGEKFKEAKTAARKGTKPKGDYGDGKAKMNSRYMRRAVAGLRDTGSILVVICQTRDNIDAGMFEPDQTRAGGRALKFYSTVELWTSVGPKLKKTINGRERQIGITARVAVKKNRITGKEWTVTVPLHWSLGLDDVGGCVDYLAEEKRWPKSQDGKIDGGRDFAGCVGFREKVVQFIQENDLEEDVREIVTEVWREVEAACQVERKRRYQ